MTLNVRIHADGFDLKPEVGERIEHMLDRLDQRIAHFSEPKAVVRLREEGTPKLTAVDLRVELGSHAGELVSHQTAPTADHAMRLALEDVERQLERRLSTQRGEASYGVPSRREPRTERPAPLTKGQRP